MSYILDSLKKSDKERRSMDTPASIVMSSPAFLENDKKRSSYKWLIVLLVIMVILAGIYFLFPHFKTKFQTIDFGMQQSTKESAQTVSKAIPVSSKEKEEAVLLYKQALANKSQPEIDSLYKKLNDRKLDDNVTTVQTEQLGSTMEPLEPTSETEPTLSIASVQESPNVIEEQPAPTLNTEPKIPSIYELDAYVRKTIPSVDYGAHIYATDNNSGFVILDGARRRVGDKLDSGLYVEKIEEESVVLSYNGTLFSLPAMKSWQGK